MRAPIDVAVNLTWLAPGRVGGSEEHLVRQLGGLVDTSIDVTLYVQSSFAAAHPALADRFELVVQPFGRDWRAVRVAAEHSWLALRTLSADVVHHGGGTVPALGGRPAVVTVHDLQYRRFPEYFSAARRRYLDLMMPRSVRRAAIVMAPSGYVRTSVIEAFDVEPQRVVVVPHGIPELGPVDAADVADVRGRFGLGDRPYVVYPAITHPHKRHRLLVEMLASCDTDLAVLMIGGAGSAEPEIRRAAARAGVEDRVVRPGRVAAGRRDALIAGAEALVFPSEYEGFGAPLVEAMDLGTPVVCGDHPAMVEVVGDAAVVVSSPTPGAWSEAVDRARSDRAALVAAGAARRRRFTPEVAGKALAGVYRTAYGGAA